MKRKIYVIISFLFIFGEMMFAQNAASIELDSDKYEGISISIRYFDRTMYYPGEIDTNPIKVHVSIKNNSPDTFRFKLADDRIFSLDFRVCTIKNTWLPQTSNIREKRTSNKTVYFREIAIESGEEYSFVENLKEYIDIAEPSLYYVEMNFYPELYKSKIISIPSNRLALEIRPSPSAAAGTFIPVEANSVAVLIPEEISPDKVVEQTIIARQKSLWDQYFLYMDVEAMLMRNPASNKRYTRSSADERERMIANYKADLMQARIDNDIVAVPEKFEIEKTVYTKTEGMVTVTEWFKYPNFHEKKSYVYKVRQREGIWQIYDYTVTNLGTE